MRYLFVLLVLAGCESQSRYLPFAAKEAERIWIIDTHTGRVALCAAGSQMIACSRFAGSMTDLK